MHLNSMAPGPNFPTFFSQHINTDTNTYVQRYPSTIVIYISHIPLYIKIVLDRYLKQSGILPENMKAFSPVSSFSPVASPLPSPKLMPVSPSSRRPSAAFQQLSMKRAASSSAAATETAQQSATPTSTQSPTRMLSSTSTVSLLSLSLQAASPAAAAAAADEVSAHTSIETVLQAPPAGHPSPTAAVHHHRRYAGAGKLSPSASYTSTAGQYFSSAQHRRVSHYSTSASQRSSAVNLLQLAGAADSAAAVPTSRRSSFGGQHNSALVPDSPSLGPVSVCGSPSRLFLAQTPPAAVAMKHIWRPGSSSSAVGSTTTTTTATTNGDYFSLQHLPATIADVIQDARMPDAPAFVRNTAVALTAALESEINKSQSQLGQLPRSSSSSCCSGYYLSSKYDDDEGDRDNDVLRSPELRPARTPAEMPTPMVLDL